MFSCNLLTFGYISLRQICTISRVHRFQWGKSPPLTILSRQLSLCSSFYWQNHRAVRIEIGCCPNKGLENHINSLHITVCFVVCLFVSNKGRGEKSRVQYFRKHFFLQLFKCEVDISANKLNVLWCDTVVISYICILSENYVYSLDP